MTTCRRRSAAHRLVPMRLRMSHMKSGLSSLLLVAAFAARVRAAALVVQPSALYLSAARGETVDATIAISSAEARPVPLTFELAAFTRDDSGRPHHTRMTAAETVA